MPAEFEEKMKALFQLSLQEEYQKQNDDFERMKEVELDADGISRLSQKILVLPIEYKNALFSRYCFEFSSQDTEAIFELKNARGQLSYAQRMLAFFMGITDARIDDKSLQAACNNALKVFAGCNGDNSTFLTPKYSARFRMKLRNIKAAQKPVDYLMLIAKRVAIFFLVCTIGFSTILVANADVREQFLDWLVETFPRFSIFYAPNVRTDGTQAENLSLLESTYIPEGFVIHQTDVLTSTIFKEYVNSKGELLQIIFSDQAGAHMDTEGATIQQLPFKEDYAYFWEKDGFSFLVWQQDEIFCQIIAQIEKSEAIKIAKNILLQNK